MNFSEERKQTLGMTAETVGKDILAALVQEIKMLPDIWEKLSEAKQNDVIDRLRSRVEHNVKMAVTLIAANGQTVVVGDLDSITIKDGVKGTIKFSASTPSIDALYSAAGKQVLVTVAQEVNYTANMHEVRGESDQRAFDLGSEYTDKDGAGMEFTDVPYSEVDDDTPQIPHVPVGLLENEEKRGRGRPRKHF